jgi:hypothetical protein
MRARIIFFVTLILISCGDLVTFEAPQPEGLSNIKGIPKKFVGQYLSLNDSSKLTITSQKIIKFSITHFSKKIDSVDIKEIKRDTGYVVVDNKVTFDIKVKGDSTFQHWSYYDTIFDASRGDILRKYKGHYFLNEQVSAKTWRVTAFTKISNGLTLGAVSSKEDINKLRELTDTKSDSIFSFRPKKKELKKFLEENGFSDKDTYIKIK